MHAQYRSTPSRSTSSIGRSSSNSSSAHKSSSQQSNKPVRLDDIHHVAFWGGVGYSGLVNSYGMADYGQHTFIGGGGGLIGVGYEYHYKRFQLSVGPEFRIFSSQDNLLFMPGHLIMTHEASDDYRASLLVISPEFLAYIRQMHPNHYHAEYHGSMVFQLTDSQYQTICACYKLLHDISLLDQLNRKDILTSQMDVVAYLAETFFQRNGQMRKHQKNRTQQLLINFHNAVAEHYKESREVSFYAEKLCISAKHFGTIIKRETGIGGVQWIARYVVTQAKDLLLHRPDMTIQQIGQELGFPDQTVFSRYFKKHEGISPSEYRRQ